MFRLLFLSSLRVHLRRNSLHLQYPRACQWPLHHEVTELELEYPLQQNFCIAGVIHVETSLTHLAPSPCQAI